jgi:hypothetical protein
VILGSEPQDPKDIFLQFEDKSVCPCLYCRLEAWFPGSYDFGKINSTKHTGPITYIPVRTGKSLWEFTSNGYAVGSDTFQNRSINTIADTGATVLFLPDVIVSAYYAKVQEASNNSAEGGYTFKCSAELSSLTLGIRSYKAIVPGSYLKFTPIDRRGINCFGALQANIDADFSVFGDVFLKSRFVVFNAISPPRIGFAPKLTGPANELIHPSDTHKTFAFLISCQSESRRLISPIIQYIMWLRR